MKKLYLIILVTCTSLHSMTFIRKHITQEVAKKGVYRAMRDIHHLISTAPFIIESYLALQEYSQRDAIIASWVEASPIVQNFVREELKQQGMKNIDTIKITKNTLNAAYAAYYGKVLLVGSQGTSKYFNTYVTHDGLEKALLDTADTNPDSRLIINTARFCIGHEKTHLQHHDTLHRHMLVGMIPFVTHGICKLAVSNIFFIKNLSPYSYTVSFLKLPTACIKYTINELGIKYYRRYCEWRADEEVINDIDVLDAGRQLYKDGYEWEQKNLTPEHIKEKQKNDVHMSNLNCMQRLEKRIARLKEPEKDKDNVLELLNKIIL